ncbi:MAG: hypothetical protein U1E63_07160 [Burkholderiales bacterium]
MHEYMRRLLLAVGNGAIDGGTVALARVAHDDDCAFLRGGTCGCDPDITIRTDVGDALVQADGTLRRQGTLQ